MTGFLFFNFIFWWREGIGITLVLWMECIVQNETKGETPRVKASYLLLLKVKKAQFDRALHFQNTRS
jgi:hypothetical protein